MKLKGFWGAVPRSKKNYIPYYKYKYLYKRLYKILSMFLAIGTEHGTSITYGGRFNNFNYLYWNKSWNALEHQQLRRVVNV